MSASPNLRLPYLDANQNQKTVTHNAALRMLDALVNLHVASTALSAPPAAPNDGQCWIVASGGTGAWLGKDLNVAAWQDGAWSFYAPNPGTVAYVDALGGALMWNGTAWVSLLGAITTLGLAALGIGTGADATNPLSAKLNAALFAALPTTASPAGTGDVRVKLSKQAAGNTASLLFQDAYAGRAEIGLLADDNLHVKVSPDGASVYDAIVVTAAGGDVSFLVSPGAPTPAAGDASTKLATTAFVAAAVSAVTGSGGGSVTSVAGRTGAVTLGVGDVSGAAPLVSPALTGTPTAPSAAAGTNSAQLATTSFVAANFATYAYASATYATAASATLTGTPTGPTPAQNDNSTKLATTAYADRAAAALITRMQVADAAYVVQPSDRTVAVTALTAGRVITLPAASAYPQGTTLTIVDESGACSATTTLTLVRAGGDTVNGSASAVIASPYGYLALQSNGSNKWTVVDQAIAPAALATVAQGQAGSQIQFGVLEQLVALSGASTSSTIQIPNRAIVFAVSARTVTAITGAPSYGVGVSGNATQFGGSLGSAAGSSNSGIIGPSGFYSPTPIVITATSGSFTGGAVRIAIQYALFNVPGLLTAEPLIAVPASRAPAVRGGFRMPARGRRMSSTDTLSEIESDLATLASLPGEIRAKVKAGVADLTRLRDSIDTAIAGVTSHARSTLQSIEGLAASGQPGLAPATGADPAASDKLGA